MDLRKIKKLMELLEESGLAEIDGETGEVIFLEVY